MPRAAGPGYWIIKAGGWEALKGGWTKGFWKVGGWRGLSRAFRKRVYCINIVQYSAPILRRRRGDAEIDVGVVIQASWSYVKTCWSCFWSFVGAHPPSKNFIFAPTRRSTSDAQPYVRLCVCFGSLLTRSKRNINSSCQVPGLYRVEVQRPISSSPN